jgi:hypothetical protein
VAHPFPRFTGLLHYAGSFKIPDDAHRIADTLIAWLNTVTVAQATCASASFLAQDAGIEAWSLRGRAKSCRRTQPKPDRFPAPMR